MAGGKATDGSTTAISAARAMLDAFASVGARHFDVTWTNSAGQPRRPRRLRTMLHALGGPLPEPKNPDWLDSVHIEGIAAVDLARTMPAMLDTASGERLNLIVRPYGNGVSFIQLDDLTAEKLPRIAPAMFLIIETSPGSFQAWLALPGDHDKEFARRVRKGAGADLSASGATRISGSRNFKAKYAPDFPRVEIREVRPGHMTNAAQLDQLGLVAPPDEFAPLPPPRSFGDRPWPSYAKALDGAPLNRDGDGPDRSRADFVWCMTAYDWGFTEKQIAERLMEESSKAREYGRAYADLTATNAALAVERRRPVTRRQRIEGHGRG